jgi:hypothetical protein
MVRLFHVNVTLAIHLHEVCLFPKLPFDRHTEVGYLLLVVDQELFTNSSKSTTSTLKSAVLMYKSSHVI